MGYKLLISITLASNPAVLHGRPHTPDGRTLKDFVSEVKSNLRGEILALMGTGFNMPNNFMANFMQDQGIETRLNAYGPLYVKKPPKYWSNLGESFIKAQNATT